MKKVSRLSFLVVCLIAISCSSTKPPSFVSKVPCKKDFICAVGVATGNRLQMAISEAAQNARISIGQNISTNISGLIRQASEEINDESAINNFQQTAETVFDISLKDTQVEKQDIQTKRGQNTVYVLMSYDEGRANERLLKKIEEDKKLYDAFRTTQLYDDMKKKVDEFRARNTN